MLRNYLKIALRSLGRRKGYSALNIIGLAVGLAVCLLILIYVRYETSFDDYHASGDRAYRIQRAWINADGSISQEFSNLAPSYVPLLKGDFPEIERIARIWGPGGTVVKVDDRVFTEDRFFFAEPEIFDILTIHIVQGDRTSALADTGTVVLSRSMAKKFFGGEDVLGRTVMLDFSRPIPLRVTGVMEDTPPNSHVHFDFLASYSTLAGFAGSGEGDYFLGTRNFSDNVTGVYARLAQGVAGRDIQAKIPAFLDRHFPPRTDDQGRVTKMSAGSLLRFVKVRDIHLTSHTMSEYEPNGDARIVVLFTAVALFILAIAVVNFVNLSTALAVKRAKEVGLRKVVGAARRTLSFQFLGESYLVTLLALVLALVAMAFVLPLFREFSGQALSLSRILTPANGLVVLAGFLVTGLAAGVFPAMYLASFRPGTILRGRLTRGRGGAVLRKTLVVFQFAVSIGLVFSVIVISRQMNHIRNADLGFERNNIILVPINASVRARWTDIKARLLQEKEILAATLSKRAPTGRLGDAPGWTAQVDGREVRNTFRMPHNRVEHDFFKTYGMTLVAGRDFSLDFPTDAAEAFILNETAVRQLGFKNPEAAVGVPFGTFAPNKTGRIIGVVRDFNYESLREKIIPIVTYIAPGQANTLSVRIAPGSLNKVLGRVQNILDSISPAGPVRYDFLTDRIAALYRNEERTMKMFTAFGVLAILVACLGLFGLAAFSAERRTKEIGVRKVLGASVPGLALLLTKEFAKWVVAANLIAWPAAYLGMREWLGNFAYRASIGAWPFIGSAVAALVVAVAATAAQSLKAAVADPVKALKYE